jgi:hypothetical protein
MSVFLFISFTKKESNVAEPSYEHFTARVCDFFGAKGFGAKPFGSAVR